MKYKIITYGCQMNWSDSERITATLDKMGGVPAADGNRADLVVFNACSVRQSAIDRIYGKVNNYRSLAAKHRPILILAGCVLEKDKQALASNFDLVLNIKTLNEWPSAIKAYLKQRQQKVRIAHNSLQYFHIRPRYQTNFRAHVPISSGCDNYCTYCVVPYVRGPELNRPAEEIIGEVKNLIKNGYKEIWLLGQNVNSYKSKAKSLKSLKSRLDFADLLQIINDLPGEFRIKFISSHPKDMSDKLISAVARCDKICKYIHLPLQSGDNNTLKKMHRRYTVGHYQKLIEKIRQLIPDAAISTDIIVGFPGETKKQFANTAKLMRQVGFDMAYLSQYSSRPQTTAAKLTDNVSKAEKAYRENCLNEILKKTALKNNQQYVDQTKKVLVDSVKNNFAFGKTDTEKSVKFSIPKKIRPQTLLGQLITVKIIRAIPWGLWGKIIKK